MPKLSIAELQDRLELFFGRRLDIGKSESTRDDLARLDAELVGWFAERDIELVIDRDPVTHRLLDTKRITLLQARLDMLIGGLSHALTGKVPQVIADIHKDALLRGEEFYLADGGYSRLIVSIETGKARLTDNSTQRAKDAWAGCADTVGHLERCVDELRQLNDYDHPGA